MTNNIIYPILIILFSILIIFGLLNNRQNNKLITNIERYRNIYLNVNKTKIKESAANNINFSVDLINGNWTCNLTTVDSTYNASNFIVITLIDMSLLDPISTSYGKVNSVPTSYGILTYNGFTYDINFLVGENLNAIKLLSDGTKSSDSMHIKFFNNMTNETQNGVNPVFYKPETFNSIVTLFSGKMQTNKFASYKVYTDNNKNIVGGELYRIIKSNDIYIDQPSPLYDYNVYDTIVNDYKLTSEYMKAIFGKINVDVLNTINNKYDGEIHFCMQRVFESPAGSSKELITRMSKKIKVSVVQNNMIPNSLEVVSFNNDKTENKLNNMFRPKATLLYFYKLNNINTSYSYKDPSTITQPQNVLNLQNNAQTMFNSTLSYNDLKSITKTNNNNYIITLVGKYTVSNLYSPLIIPFSDLYNKL